MRRRLIRSVPSSIWGVLPLVFAAMVVAGAAFAQTASPIKVGFSIPLTGGLASNGRAILAAYQMWQDDINAKGGLSAARSSSSTMTTRAIRRWFLEFTPSCWMSTKSTS